MNKEQVIEKIARYHFRYYATQLGLKIDDNDFDTCTDDERNTYIEDARKEVAFLESLGYVQKADAIWEGRKEVIDWILKENGVYANYKGVIISLGAGVWQAKLKEWDW